MNPFRWPRAHQLAGVFFCLFGALVGLFVAFALEKSSSDIPSARSISGEWADNTVIFLTWLDDDDWPLPLLGVAIAGLLFYFARLLAARFPAASLSADRAAAPERD